jgi:hypothetical protein
MNVIISEATPRVAYGTIIQSPVLIWMGKTVREVIRFTIRVTDAGGLTASANVEIGVLSAADIAGPDPQTTGVSIPSLLGLQTRGGETITITGRFFNKITTAHGGVVRITLNAQENDLFPNRSYLCTNPRVVNDNTIQCTSPHGWGGNLFLKLTYDTTQIVMASASGALLVSYATPSLITTAYSLGGLFSFPSDRTLCDRAQVPTTGGCTLLLSAQNLGVQADASRAVRFEFGQPVPGTDRLEYSAPYVPCRTNLPPLPTTYETWASPSNPNGVGNGQSRICVPIPPGIGRFNRFQVRVGTIVSNLSYYDPAVPGFDGWHVSYITPRMVRVWRPINANGDAPLRWDNTANAGDIPPGQQVWFK